MHAVQHAVVTLKMAFLTDRIELVFGIPHGLGREHRMREFGHGGMAGNTGYLFLPVHRLREFRAVNVQGQHFPVGEGFGHVRVRVAAKAEFVVGFSLGCWSRYRGTGRE